MKTKSTIILVTIFTLIIIGCYVISSSPDILIKKDFNGDGVAVLNFSTQGNFMSLGTGKIAADKLTDAMFLIGKFNVIDRSNVNKTQNSLEIKSTEFLSADDIQKLGLKLRANYLVLGIVQQVGGDTYVDSDSKKELYISFRIISVLNSDVVGLGRYSSNYYNNIIEKIETMMNEIVTKMKKD